MIKVDLSLLRGEEVAWMDMVLEIHSHREAKMVA